MTLGICERHDGFRGAPFHVRNQSLVPLSCMRDFHGRTYELV